MENTPKEKASQPKEPKRKGSITGLLVGVIAFLFLTIVGILLFVFTDLCNTLYNEVRVEKDVQEEEQETDQGTDDPQKEDDQEDTEHYSIGNEGWALFSLPEERFSVEIPKYFMSQELGIENEEVNSYWKVKYSDRPFNEYYENNWYSELHSELSHIVNILFYPERIPESVACGQGCVKEHSITVYIYDDSREFDQIKELYTNGLQGLNNEDEPMYQIDVEDEEKWGYSTLHYEVQGPGGGYSGYVLNTGSKTYHISYYINGTPEESKQIAQKVLDSMKFE